jgi:hypothetical protein
LGAGLVVVFEGAVAAVRARQSRVEEVERALQSRPWLTAEYSNNATEEEPDVADTLILENIGSEPALAISIATEPSSFMQATPRLGLPLNTLLPHTKTEVVIFGLDGLLHRLRRRILEHRGKCPELRIPFRIQCADLHGRTWINEYAAVYYFNSVLIEDVTGRPPNWTELSDISAEQPLSPPRALAEARTA